VNNEQERACSDELWPNLRYYSGHLSGGTEENHESLRIVGVLAEIQTRHSRIQVRRNTNWANMLWGEGVECGASQWGGIIAQNVHLAAEERMKMWNDTFQFHSTMHFIPTITQ
jgi:hypothetical protein